MLLLALHRSWEVHLSRGFFGPHLPGSTLHSSVEFSLVKSCKEEKWSDCLQFQSGKPRSQSDPDNFCEFVQPIHSRTVIWTRPPKAFGSLDTSEVFRSSRIFYNAENSYHAESCSSGLATSVSRFISSSLARIQSTFHLPPLFSRPFSNWNSGYGSSDEARLLPVPNSIASLHDLELTFFMLPCLLCMALLLSCFVRCSFSHWVMASSGLPACSPSLWMGEPRAVTGEVLAAIAQCDN